MKRSLVPTVLATLVLAVPLHAQSTYQVTDIGLLGGAPTFATSLNTDGIVCGYALPDSSTAKAWVFDLNTLTELPGLGGTDTRAMTVAPDGRIYGYSTDTGGLSHAVRWQNSVATDLGPASGTAGWFVQAVNGSGTLVGHTGTATTPDRGFTFSQATSTFANLPPLAGALPPATSAAYDINDAGQIAGVSSWIGGGTRAFLTDSSGVPISLGTLGANDSTATALNSAGDVVGYSVTAGNQTHAFIHTAAGGLRDLGVAAGTVESRALGVNDTGIVVGSAVDSAGASRAFVWEGSGTLIHLNSFIPPNSGWVLNEAQAINSGGDIVGNGTLGGVPHAFILERFEGLDTLAPIVTGKLTSTYNGYPSSTVVVDFWDNEKVVGDTTHSLGLISISGPNGFYTGTTLQSWYAADRQASTSTFVMPAPGGSWDGADNGSYEIRLAPNSVSDLAGNLHPGGVIGTFTVGIQTAPTVTISGLPSTGTLGVSVNLTFSATSSYPSAPGDVFNVLIDWDGDGVDLQSVSATTNTTIPHAFTSLGTHTVRVTATDPHSLTTTERTAQIAISNPGLPLISTTIAGQTGYFSSMSGVRVAEKAGTFYMFGGYPLSNDNTPVVTWNYATPGSPFIFRGDLDNGPIQPEGAATDGRGRICVWGGYEPAASATTNGMTYTLAGGGSGGMASKPTANSPAVAARDNLGRLYSITTTIAYRYDAGASGNGSWSTLTPPPGIPCSSACYDGAGRIIVFGGTTVWAYNITGNTWAQLPNSPVAFYSPATLGADGFIYLSLGNAIHVFNPATNTSSVLGLTTYDHTGLPSVLGGDGLLYLLGGSYAGGAANIETLNTHPASTLAPRITSIPAGTSTLSAGTAWTYTVAASGKPAPAFSLAAGPAGMTVNSSSGLVAWTPGAGQIGTHYARVQASNSGGTATQLISLTVLGTPPDTTPPVAVTGLAAYNITLNSADISWNATTDNVGVLNYRVMEQRTSGNRWHRVKYYYTLGTTTGLSWHIGGLPTGSSKTLYVAAVDAAGNLGTPVSVSFALIAPPALYASQSGTFQGSRAIVGEPWTGNVITALGNPVPTLTPGTFPAGAVWHSTAANTGYFTWTAAAGQEGTQTFTFNATNSGGPGSISQTVTVYPAGTDLIPPGAPSSLAVDRVGYDSCRVTWGPAADNYGVVGYRVSAVHREARRRFHRGRYDDHVVSFDVPASASQTVIPGLRASTSYIVSVTAVDAAGLWGYAATQIIRTLLQPFVVEAAQVTTTVNGDGSNTMTWPGYGYYWAFTVECSTDLAHWSPVEPASQWPSFATSFTFAPDGSPAKYFRVKAVPAAAP